MTGVICIHVVVHAKRFRNLQSPSKRRWSSCITVHATARIEPSLMHRFHAKQFHQAQVPLTKRDQGKINVLKFSYEYEEIKNQVDVVVVGLSTEHTPCNLVRRSPVFSHKLFISWRSLPSFNPVCRDLVGEAHQTFGTKISRYLASVYVFTVETRFAQNCHGNGRPCIRRTCCELVHTSPVTSSLQHRAHRLRASSARPTVGSPSFFPKTRLRYTLWISQSVRLFRAVFICDDSLAKHCGRC